LGVLLMMVLVGVVSWLVTRRRREAPCRASTSHLLLPGDEVDLAKDR
jgi:cbb3-type cytochrome oxidase subunit 3